MLVLSELHLELENLEVERIHIPFLIEQSGNSQECYYGDVFDGYGLRGESPHFNILTRRHYTLLKNGGKTGVYTIGASYDQRQLLLAQIFSERVADSVATLLATQSIPLSRVGNNQKYKGFINLSCMLPLGIIRDM